MAIYNPSCYNPITNELDSYYLTLVTHLIIWLLFSPCGNEITSVVVQGFDFIMFDMIKSFLVIVFNAKGKTSRVLFAFSD